MNLALRPLPPFTPEQRAAIRRDHRRDEILTPDEQVDTFCRLCYLWGEAWPCTTIRLLDELDEAWVAIEKARQ